MSSKYIEHLKTITKHKFYVMRACFRSGFIIRGLLHDNSKFGPTEFISSAKHFQGTRSPIKAEKEDRGYSIAWQNHKGRNRHHWQYWIDWHCGKEYVVEMPVEYIVELICDWIGAGKAYKKEEWAIDELRTWYEKSKDDIILHNKTRKFLEYTIYFAATSEKQLFRWLNHRYVDMNYDTVQALYKLSKDFEAPTYHERSF